MKEVDLVIIGGGTAGMAAAISASLAGVDSIVIIEKEAYLGGILQQCIHNGFGLTIFKEELTGPEYADRYIKAIEEHKINVLLNTMVTKITKDKEVHYANIAEGEVSLQAKAIICAMGCSERTRAGIMTPGDRPVGVLTAGLAQKYINIDGYAIGKKVFILGSGDIGLIMARRLKYVGAEVLGVAEIMPYSNGLNRNLVQCLHDYDIPLYLSHTVSRIIGKDRVEKIILSAVDENLKIIPGSEREIKADTLLLSVGLIPSNRLLEEINIPLHPKTKGPLVDENYETIIPGIFSCGNSLHVHDLVDNVSIEASKAGLAVSKYLKDMQKHQDKIILNSGQGIAYVLPQHINYDVKETLISYRVNKPLKSVSIVLKQNDQIIKKINKAFIFPAEMEQISFNPQDLKTHDNLTLEVLE